MHQLAAYLKEHEGFDCVVNNLGFASYRLSGDECYIRDIWVNPDYRKGGIGSRIANEITEIAKAAGCKYLTGSVNTNAKNPTISTKALLAYGFEVHSTVPGGIIFRKEL